MSYRTEVVDSTAGFRSLRAEWDDLLDRTGSSTIFQTWEWLFSWWEVFGGSARLRVVTVRDGTDRLVGAAPVQLRTARYYGFPVRELSFVGDPDNDSQDFILDSGNLDAAGTLFGALHDQEGWDIIRLEQLPENSSLLALEAQDRVKSEESSLSPFLRVQGNWEDYHRSLSKKLRGDIRNKTNRLKKRGAWAVRRVTEPDAGVDLIEEMLALENLSHKPDAGIAVFSRKGAPEFLRSFIRLAGTRGWVDYATLDLEGQPLGFLLGFVRKGTYLAYTMAFAQDAAETSPGKLLIHEVIRRFFELPGSVEVVDFSRGETYVKALWCTEARRQHRLVAFRPGIYPALLRAAAFRVRPLIKRFGGVWRSTGDTAHRFGLGAAMKSTACRVLSAAVFMREVVGFRLTSASVSTQFLEAPPGFVFGRGSDADLRACLEDPAFELTETFATAAIGRGDVWYVLRQAGRVVSYLWRSERTTEVYPGLAVAFSAEWSYTYKFFTLTTLRGRRLIAHLNGLVLGETVAQGKSGLICIVESVNYPSLHSCEAIGYEPFARALVTRLGGRMRVWRRRGSGSRGFRLVPG